jgi:hypothetical protein
MMPSAMIFYPFLIELNNGSSKCVFPVLKMGNTHFWCSIIVISVYNVNLGLFDRDRFDELQFVRFRLNSLQLLAGMKGKANRAQICESEGRLGYGAILL